ARSYSEDAVWAVTRLRDGRVAFGDGRGLIWIWDSDTGGVPRQLVAHDGGIHAIAVLSDDRIVSAGYDKRLIISQPDSPQDTSEIGIDAEGTDALVVSKNDDVISGTTTGHIRIWEHDKPGVPYELGSHDTSIRGLAVLSDGRVVAVSSDGVVRIH